jgi:NAD(P) transhydrogenase subunit beta
MNFADTGQTLVQLSYLAAAFLFIVGLKRMSSPLTAVSGVRWAGVGMVLATVVTLVCMHASTLNLISVRSPPAARWPGSAENGSR